MNPRIQKIIELTSFYFGIDSEKVKSKSQKANHVLARHVSILLSYEFVLPIKSRVAECFCLDHSTVIHALKTINNYPSIQPHLDYLRHKVTKELDLQLSERIKEINAS